jgi:hypothetical protein
MACNNRLGVIHVDADAKRVTLRPADGVKFFAGDKAFVGERVFATDKPDWVGLGRLRFHIIDWDGRYVLRLADNESAVRKNFPGCMWYGADGWFKVDAKFVAYGSQKTRHRGVRHLIHRFLRVGVVSIVIDYENPTTLLFGRHGLPRIGTCLTPRVIAKISKAVESPPCAQRSDGIQSNRYVAQ